MGVATIDPPPTNTQLAQVATYSYTGQTHITLNGHNMTVTNAGLNSGTPTSEPIVANTVVYVSSSTGAWCRKTAPGSPPHEHLAQPGPPRAIRICQSAAFPANGDPS